MENKSASAAIGTPKLLKSGSFTGTQNIPELNGYRLALITLQLYEYNTIPITKDQISYINDHITGNPCYVSVTWSGTSLTLTDRNTPFINPVIKEIWGVV